MSCKDQNGQFRWFYTGNQVGNLNETGFFNFVAGGLPGSGISAGTLVKKFFQDGISRALWQNVDAILSQKLLDAAFPFIDLKWIAEIELSSEVTIRVSNRNTYVEGLDGSPRFYEARVQNAPSISITAGEWLNPNFEIGDVRLSMNNRDGFFNQFLPQGENYTQWIGSKVSILVGFGESRENYFEIFRGTIPPEKGVQTTLEEVIITAYDRFDDDEVEIPTLLFDRTNFPFVDSDKIGNSLPIIYGDWSVEVSEFGDIPATCSNALDDPIVSYVWNISENALREIGDIYLHRGNRNESDQGPIKLLDSAIVKEPDRGRILIPAGVPVLEEVFNLISNGRPGATGGVGEILAESSTQDFTKLGVEVGDSIVKTGDTTVYEVTSVSAGALQTTIPTVMTQDDSYRIFTDKYVFKSGDRISLFCKGKDVDVMSVTRLADSGLVDIDPIILSIGLENDFWTIDNVAQKIYNVSFDDEVLLELDFSDVDPDISQITGLDIQTDGTLWLFDRPLSKVFRYVISEGEVRLSFNTIQVSGLGVALEKGGPLAIDDGNILTIHDQVTGNFYRINPFAGAQAGLVATYNRDDFEPLATDIVDIAADVNENQIVVMDRSTGKVYRIDESNGALISGSAFSMTERINEDFTQARGIGYYIDGTIFLLNKQDLSVYNFNEFEGASENPGFIARDILQSYVGKSTFDFDLRWNETSRGSLSPLKARAYIDEPTTSITFLNRFFTSFNVSMYVNFQKYSIFHISFENFTTDGLPIREGDIKMGTFNPSKEYGQYFNSAFSNYKERPFSGRTIKSDNYVSPSGVQLAGKEIKRELDMRYVYRRSDLDTLVPLFVRLASAEPEFVSMTTSFRFIFAQLNVFYNINFKDLFNPNEKSGRRFDDVPSFVRKIIFNLDNMTVDFKLWSLGTTQFGNFLPVGVFGGGQNDQIILTNLGTAGYVAPAGTITASGTNSVTLEDVDLQDAENRQANVVGKAWLGGYKVGLYNGETHQLVEELEIDSVSGQVVTFKSNLVTTVVNTIKNSAGFIVGGHYLKYLSFNSVKQQQTTFFGYFGKPIEGYPATTTQEIEEQRAGTHSFLNGRLPYVLHPKNFVPN